MFLPPECYLELMNGQPTAYSYWRANLRMMALLLALWFVLSFGLGILWVEPLNQFKLGGFPLGFWFAQQGSIYGFVALIAVYVLWMDRLDRRFQAGAETGAATATETDAEAEGEPK